LEEGVIFIISESVSSVNEFKYNNNQTKDGFYWLRAKQQFN